MRNKLRLAAALAVVAPLSALSAQTVHTRTGTAAGSVAPATAAAPARIAGIAPPPPTFIIVSGDERFFNAGVNGTVIFANIPAFVLQDGRVFANFGRGIEQVVRPCGGLLNTTNEGLFATNGQPVVSQPSVVQPTPGASQPLPFTPAVPNQPTVSQQMLVQALATGPVLVNSISCWAANRVGQVFVTRP
jgi:hypothetical protein